MITCYRWVRKEDSSWGAKEENLELFWHFLQNTASRLSQGGNECESRGVVASKVFPSKFSYIFIRILNAHVCTYMQHPLNQVFSRKHENISRQDEINESQKRLLGLPQFLVFNISHLPFIWRHWVWNPRHTVSTVKKLLDLVFSDLRSVLYRSIQRAQLPRLSWWCIITVNCIWLMHASNGHSIDVFQSVWPAQTRPEWGGVCNTTAACEAGRKSKYLLSFSSSQTRFQDHDI